MSPTSEPGQTDDTEVDCAPSQGAASGRPWLPPLVIAALLTVIAVVGLHSLGGDDGAEDHGGIPDTPSGITGYLAASDEMLADIADAVGSASDLDGVRAAADVAGEHEDAARALVVGSATLDPLPSVAQSDLLAQRYAFISALAGFGALETDTLANFGDLATTLTAVAVPLDEAQAVGGLQEDNGTQVHADDSEGTPISLVAHDSISGVALTAQLTTLIGTVAARSSTEQLIGIVGDLETAENTAGVRDAVADAGALSAYATSARDGLGSESEPAATLAAHLDLLEGLVELGELDGDSLDLWRTIGVLLRQASSALDGQLGESAQAAYAHLDTLVASARATLQEWQDEVASSPQGAAITGYEDAVEAVLTPYADVVDDLPDLAADAEPDGESTDLAAFAAAAQSLEELQSDLDAVDPPPALASDHPALTDLVGAGVEAASAGEDVVRAAEDCVADSPTDGPTDSPTDDPTTGPTTGPTTDPTTNPSAGPNAGPSAGPNAGPSTSPDDTPSSSESSGSTSGSTKETAALAPAAAATTPAATSCAFGEQSAWDDYVDALTAAQDHDTVTEAWQEAVDAALARVTPRPRPEV